MNKVILMGRLTKAPEIKYLQDDNKTAMARYTLAVDRRYGKDREREADFISCVTFGKNAEFAEIYLKKGTKIVISGRIRTGSYTDSEGVKRYSSNIVVEEHFFAESKKASDTDSKDEKDGFMSVTEDEELRLNVFAKMWNYLIKQSSFFWQKGFSRIRIFEIRLQKWLLEEENVQRQERQSFKVPSKT